MVIIYSKDKCFRDRIDDKVQNADNYVQKGVTEIIAQKLKL